MVDINDQTVVSTAPTTDNRTPSFKRWLRHFCYTSSTKRYFKPTDQQAIADAVRQAEQGHIGEIQVVIEGHIPCAMAYHIDTEQRARQLFASLGVWDTEANSGVLLYLNLCERQVEIVTDRGIHNATQPEQWHAICQHIIVQMQQRHYRQAVVQGVLQIGQILQAFYNHQQPDQNNELGNAPIMLN
ncbi:MAG: TPM domain-containing protein [Acinetobacter sp.]